jgi:hypothetical protein
MKTYQTPRLVPRGQVVEQTQGMIIGSTDPDGRTEKQTDSIGFGL